MLYSIDIRILEKFSIKTFLLVSCKCDVDFGNVDCSVDLRKSPIFTLVESCCDSRTMNCPVFHGIGPHFSTTDQIEYKMELLTGTTKSVR